MYLNNKSKSNQLIMAEKEHGSEFEAIVSDIQEVEQRSATQTEEARKRKELAISRARGKATEMLSKLELEAKELKASLLAKGRKEIEAEENRIISDAESQAAKLRKAKPSVTFLNHLVEELIKNV